MPSLALALPLLDLQCGTGEEICAAIEGHPPFQPLDRSTRPDSAGVERWRQRVREELSHRAFFHNTGEKRKGNTIWRLDESAFDGVTARQAKQLLKPGLPMLGKHGNSNG